MMTQQETLTSAVDLSVFSIPIVNTMCNRLVYRLIDVHVVIVTWEIRPHRVRIPTGCTTHVHISQRHVIQ